LACNLSPEAHATDVLSPVRKLAPRVEAVVLRLLACLSFFLACASAEVVAQAHERGTSDQVDCTDGSEAPRAARKAACLERLHDDVLPADDLSATEPESAEEDATPEALRFWLSARVAPIERFAPSARRIALASWWRQHALSSAVMAQGPPERGLESH
jgi:hypothetical protein